MHGVTALTLTLTLALTLTRTHTLTFTPTLALTLTGALISRHRGQAPAPPSARHLNDHASCLGKGEDLCLTARRRRRSSSIIARTTSRGFWLRRMHHPLAGAALGAGLTDQAANGRETIDWDVYSSLAVVTAEGNTACNRRHFCVLSSC